MKQKISLPVAVVIAVIVLALICGGLYKKYMYQSTYTVQDMAAKYRKAGEKMNAPPTMQPPRPTGTP